MKKLVVLCAAALLFTACSSLFEPSVSVKVYNNTKEKVEISERSLFSWTYKTSVEAHKNTFISVRKGASLRAEGKITGATHSSGGFSADGEWRIP